jgi:uncharacterized protein (DUF1499 family)
MRYFLYFLGCLAVFYIAFFSYLSFQSLKKPRTGLIAGKLMACPKTPNCVCSDYKNSAAYIEPFSFRGSPEAAWGKLKKAIEQTGGTIGQVTGDYIWSTYRTSMFRFMDDVEFRLDKQANVIQVRSGSRVGKGDMGMNRKRMERIRAVFNKM